MSFISKHKEIGIVKVGSKNVVEFFWKEGVPKDFIVEEIRTSCGCTTPRFDKEVGILTATYTAGKIPKHLKEKGMYVTTKRITVDTNYGDSILTFKATVIL